MPFPGDARPTPPREREPASSIGRQLRAIRLLRRWTLGEAARRSQGEFKASSLGAYERGDRAITVERLQRLAALYEADVDAVFPGTRTPSIDLVALERARPSGGIVLDLSKFRTSSDESARAVMNFGTAVKSMRREAGPSVIVVRRSDASLLASAIGCDPADVDQAIQSIAPFGVAAGQREPSTRAPVD